VSPEEKKLRKIVVDVLKALDNGSFAQVDSSIEFLSHAPKEVRAVVKGYRRRIATLERGVTAKATDAKIAEALTEASLERMRGGK